MAIFSRRSAIIILMAMALPVGAGIAASLTIHRAAERSKSAAVHCASVDGLVSIPAGVVLLGEDGDADAGRQVTVPAFRIDRHEVTNRQFASFVAATGYRTEAERTGAGAVFVAPERVEGPDAVQWWRLVAGAEWRHPTGPSSNISRAMEHPVVQVTWADASAYAAWAGRALPSREQWERAARGLQTERRAPADWAYAADGSPSANTWQGVFPVRDMGDDGHRGLAPVGCFEPNDFGVQDMIGNVWEWTSEPLANGRLIVRGGSFLCASNYCANFRPAGRQAQERDLSTSHIGFRTVAQAGA
ncbi:SUMF1/EgtB/PvdO family nonheme iron enzyme [Phenylobacterium immobile]|uniref:SUMF1/EgtB/PvdO family nonheme iron enzyme n=1 Tax=Phenylobacterium immobile TaxID=21 RepID=UPI000A622974|nr:SUMF1/EgtB/PvdO family nonheme iron enzyme [Phenylobacterium immobile]